MIDLQYPNSPSRSAPTELERIEGLLQTLYAVSTLVGLAVQAFNRFLISASEEADRRHRRAELLAAYQRRHSWKKSDLPHLQTLGVNMAIRRMERLAGRGRPVVTPHQPIGLAFGTKVIALQALLSPDSTPDKRKRAFKLSPWWRHYVEALYRGEHALAKAKGIPGPSDYAETLVGETLGISAATVHSICGGIRRMRKEWDGSANFPAMTLVEYQNWMTTGKGRWVETE